MKKIWCLTSRTIAKNLSATYKLCAQNICEIFIFIFPETYSMWFRPFLYNYGQFVALKNQTIAQLVSDEGCECTRTHGARSPCIHINPGLCSAVRQSAADSQIGQFNLIFQPLSHRPSRVSSETKASSWPSSRCQLQVDTFAPSRAPNRFRINCTPARLWRATFDIRGWQWSARVTNGNCDF